MSLQENKTLVLRFFAEMDRQNWQAMLDTLAPDFAAHVPGASKEAFDKAANTAKETCPVSRLLNTKITMDAKLAS